MRLEIPYDTGLVTVELDDANVAGVVVHAAEMESGDEREILARALSSPVDSVPLGDFLEGIRTYAEGIESYFDMLEDYNNIVFELERLTERELYAPGTARKEETGS